MASLSPIAGPAKAKSPKEIILEFRKKHAKTIARNKLSMAEIIEMKNEGRR